MFGTEEPLYQDNQDTKPTLYTESERAAIVDDITKCVNKSENLASIEDTLYNISQNEPKQQKENETPAEATVGPIFNWIPKLLNSFENAMEFISEIADTIASNFIGATADMVYAVVWFVLFIIILVFFSILAIACSLGSFVLSVLK